MVYDMSHSTEHKDLQWLWWSFQSLDTFVSHVLKNLTCIM